MYNIFSSELIVFCYLCALLSNYNAQIKIMQNIFITGASGFVGQYLVNELITKTTNQLFLLVRARKNQSASQRIKNVFEQHKHLVGSRIIPIEGELDKEYFGLESEKFEDLAHKINIVYHTAATIKFNLPYKEAYDINVGGTKTCLLLAKKAGSKFERFHHISTAYVNRQLKKDEKRAFNNTYEQTKFEAELLFKETENVPYTIYRPSIVSGNSVTGKLAASSIIYKFIILLSRNLLCKLPVDSDASLNIIPVNNFVNKMLAIGSKKESIGKTYHITHQKNTEFRALLEQACKLLNVEPPEFVSMQQIEDIPKQIMQHIEVFMPYITQSQKFEFQTEEWNANILPPCDNVISTLHHIIYNFSSATNQNS